MYGLLICDDDKMEGSAQGVLQYEQVEGSTYTSSLDSLSVMMIRWRGVPRECFSMEKIILFSICRIFGTSSGDFSLYLVKKCSGIT